MKTLRMSQKEIDRYDIISRYLRKELSRGEAAELLNLSTGRVSRLKKKARLRGAAGLIHGNRGKPGHHRIPEEARRDVVSLLLKYYADFTPTFASQKLRDKHGLAYDPKTIRQIMIEEGLWKPRKEKAGSQHRAWRQRRACRGELVQFDGSYEYWLEDRAAKCCLLAAIDDATGEILQASFEPHEGVEPVFRFWKRYLATLGRPMAIYLDKFSTYKMNTALAADNHDLKTQFGRALAEVEVEPIFANSPQAKGRVERLFRTLQDRLIKELRLAEISTMEEANTFLREVFIPDFNRRFSVEARNKSDLHRALTKKEQTKLDSIFSRQEEHTVHNDFTVAYGKRWYQLIKQQPVTVCKRDIVIVERWLDGSVHIRLRGKDLNYEVLPERPKKVTMQPWVLAATGSNRVYPKPAVNHPWRGRFNDVKTTAENVSF
jgi:hypothetical protein